jgi:hypothetical protein
MAVYDAERPIHFRDAEARFLAAVEARAALRDKERGAMNAYRDALISLAAASLRVAADYPAPDRVNGLPEQRLRQVRKLVPA